MKIFLDTNIFIRVFSGESSNQKEESVWVLLLVSNGKLAPHISNTVIAETICVLGKLYKLKKTEILRKVKKMLKMRNLVLIEKTKTTDALNLFQNKKMKFGDCLIATQIPKGVTLVTYDKDFKKIKGLKVAGPSEIVKQLGISLN